MYNLQVYIVTSTSKHSIANTHKHNFEISKTEIEKPTDITILPTCICQLVFVRQGIRRRLPTTADQSRPSMECPGRTKSRILTLGYSRPKQTYIAKPAYLPT